MRDKPQKVEWPGYGFFIEIPEGAVPPGATVMWALVTALNKPVPITLQQLYALDTTCTSYL